MIKYGFIIIMVFLQSCCLPFFTSIYDECKRYQYFNEKGDQASVIYEDSITKISLDMNFNPNKYPNAPSNYFDSNNVFHYYVSPILHLLNKSDDTLVISNNDYKYIYIESLKKKGCYIQNSEVKSAKFKKEILPSKRSDKLFNLTFKIDSLNLKYYYKNKIFIDLGDLIINNDTIDTDIAIFYKRH